jgi:hypothetical protein
LIEDSGPVIMGNNFQPNYKAHLKPHYRKRQLRLSAPLYNQLNKPLNLALAPALRVRSEVRTYAIRSRHGMFTPPAKPGQMVTSPE